MRILHLNTHSYGGAAVVARRLHTAALESGLDSHFVTQYGLPTDATPHYSAMQDARIRYTLRAMAADARLYRLGRLVQDLSQHRNLANRPEGLDVFSPMNTRQRYSDCVDAFDPDVIHLHWINGFVDHSGFFERNRHRKFVWTLHDMNPFTGGCHHSDGCVGFATSCTACPQLRGTIDADYAERVLQGKQQALQCLADDQLIIAAPSQWMLQLSKQSRVTGRFRHVHIENPAMPMAGPGALENRRAELGLPQDKKIVLFVSDNLRNVRKGFELLCEAARRMPNASAVHFVGIGQRTDMPEGLSVSFAGRMTDETMLTGYFSSADIVVNASAAENSPLVIIEALACGTPVVAFNVGGISELVDSECGVIAGERTANALAEAMTDALFNRAFTKVKIQERAARFAPARVLEKYAAAYSLSGQRLQRFHAY